MNFNSTIFRLSFCLGNIFETVVAGLIGTFTTFPLRPF